jgi:urease accessory protein
VFEPTLAAVMIALGLWAGQQPPRAGWSAAASFLLATVAGAATAQLDILPPLRPIAVASSMALLGALTAARLQVPAWIAATLAAVAGFYQGVFGTLAHFQGGTGPYSLPDLAVAAALLPVACLQLVQRLRAGWVQVVFRVLGSWIAAAGILLLALLIRIR